MSNTMMARGKDTGHRVLKGEEKIGSLLLESAGKLRNSVELPLLTPAAGGVVHTCVDHPPRSQSRKELLSSSISRHCSFGTCKPDPMVISRSCRTSLLIYQMKHIGRDLQYAREHGKIALETLNCAAQY